MSAFLALGAAFCFGLQNLAVEYGMNWEKNTFSNDRTPAFLATLISVVISVVTFWILAWRFEFREASLTVANLTPFIVVGLAYPALFRLLYFEGIFRVGSSVSAAVVSANPVVSAVLALFVFGETISLPLGLGLLLIAAGGAFLQLANRSSQQTGSSTQDLVLEKLQHSRTTDILYPVVAMVILGGAYVMMKYGLNRFPFPITASAVAQSVGFLLLGICFCFSSAAREIKHTRLSKGLGLFVLAGLFVVLAWLGQFFALNMGRVAVVVPLVYTYPLVVLFFSYALAQEFPKSFQVILGTVSIIVGAVLLKLF